MSTIPVEDVRWAWYHDQALAWDYSTIFFQDDPKYFALPRGNYFASGRLVSPWQAATLDAMEMIPLHPPGVGPPQGPIALIVGDKVHWEGPIAAAWGRKIAVTPIRLEGEDPPTVRIVFGPCVGPIGFRAEGTLQAVAILYGHKTRPSQ